MDAYLKQQAAARASTSKLRAVALAASSAAATSTKSVSPPATRARGLSDFVLEQAEARSTSSAAQRRATAPVASGALKLAHLAPRRATVARKAHRFATVGATSAPTSVFARLAGRSVAAPVKAAQSRRRGSFVAADERMAKLTKQREERAAAEAHAREEERVREAEAVCHEAHLEHVLQVATRAVRKARTFQAVADGIAIEALQHARSAVAQQKAAADRADDDEACRASLLAAPAAAEAEATVVAERAQVEALEAAVHTEEIASEAATMAQLSAAAAASAAARAANVVTLAARSSDVVAGYRKAVAALDSGRRKSHAANVLWHRGDGYENRTNVLPLSPTSEGEETDEEVRSLLLNAPLLLQPRIVSAPAPALVAELHSREAALAARECEVERREAALRTAALERELERRESALTAVPQQHLRLLHLRAKQEAEAHRDELAARVRFAEYGVDIRAAVERWHTTVRENAANLKAVRAEFAQPPPLTEQQVHAHRARQYSQSAGSRNPWHFASLEYTR